MISSPLSLLLSLQGSGTTRYGNLLPPRIRARGLDLQFPALGATGPRRDRRRLKAQPGEGGGGRGARAGRSSGGAAMAEEPQALRAAARELPRPRGDGGGGLTVAAARFQLPAAAAAHWPAPPGGGQWEAAASGAARGRSAGLGRSGAGRSRSCRDAGMGSAPGTSPQPLRHTRLPGRQEGFVVSPPPALQPRQGGKKPSADGVGDVKNHVHNTDRGNSVAEIAAV